MTGEALAPPPSFNAPAFASWFRRWKEAEGLEWPEIARRTGLARGTLQLLARGVPPKAALERGQTDLNPGITTLARLAQGLGLDLAYVLGKGGIHPGDADRWDAFSNAERALLRRALLAYGLDRDAVAERNPLLQQLERTLTEEEVPA